MIRRIGYVTCLLVVWCGGVLAQEGSAEANDVHHWPLRTEKMSPAWQFEIPADLSAQLRNAPSAHLEVHNADGAVMPIARFDTEVSELTDTSRLDWLVPKYSGNSPAVGAAGEAGVMSYRYELPAAFPIHAIRVSLASLQTTLPVALLAETEGQWKRVGQLSALGEQELDYDEVLLPAALTAKKWRLQSIGALSPAPSLRFGYAPDRFVFLAQGHGPYVLMLNSEQTSASISAPSVEKLLAEIRKQSGAEWLPPRASLGARTAGTGRVLAVQEAAKPWNKWLPWAVLGGVAILLAGIVLAGLRKRKKEQRKH